jgi:hypothetical protein
MTDAETIARARESASFVGFRYASEQMLQALHDPLTELAATLMAVLWVRVEHDDAFDRLAAWRALEELHVRLVATFAGGRRVAEVGALPALSMYEVERAMGAER